jgi:hypothetical protein
VNIEDNAAPAKVYRGVTVYLGEGAVAWQAEKAERNPVLSFAAIVLLRGRHGPLDAKFIGEIVF